MPQIVTKMNVPGR